MRDSSGSVLSRRALAVGVLLAAATSSGVQPVGAGGNWNDQQIRWRQYEQGLAAAKQDKRPICLIFYTEWCPHCTNYSRVFHDPTVVERSRQFVMIRIDKDKNRELSKKYAPDGEYIPRTYFLSPAGDLAPTIHAPRERFKYFYDERKPGSLLAGMDEALQKLR
jgi:glutaredoxin